MAATDTAQQLEWESRQRPLMTLVALVTGVFALVSPIISLLIFDDRPRAALLNGISRLSEPGSVADAPSLKIAFFELYNEKTLGVVGQSLLRALAFVGLGIIVMFLAKATRARKPEISKLLVYLGLVGGIVAGVAALAYDLSLVSLVKSFLDGSRTVAAADTIRDDSTFRIASYASLFGTLALAFGLIFICLNAMRVGLLTRFMGVMGMIVGILMIIPVGSQLPIIQTFWLIGLGLLFMGRTPKGLPPAWKSGKAEPWPSRQPKRPAPAAKKGGGKGSDSNGQKAIEQG